VDRNATGRWQGLPGLGRKLGADGISGDGQAGKMKC